VASLPLPQLYPLITLSLLVAVVALVELLGLAVAQVDIEPALHRLVERQVQKHRAAVERLNPL
jgi:hypothetical protein